jgi:type II secretory pathway pseudopilin PulG
MRVTNSGNPAEGFTVLELAIALAIAGIALVSLFQLFSSAVVTAGRADRLTEATLLARSKLAEAETIEPVSIGVSGGTAANGLVWRLETKPYPGDDQSRARHLVTIVVSISEGRHSTSNPDIPIVGLDTIAFVGVR